MLKTPEGKAWFILLAAFATFCLLAVSIPLSIRWYITDAMDIQETSLEPIDADVLVRSPNETDFWAISTKRTDILEETIIATDEYARAFLRMFENSTLTLYNDTEILLHRTRTPRYQTSQHPNEIMIEVNKGRVAIGAAPPAPPAERPLHLEIKTPHANIVLEEGGYSILVDAHETQVTVRLGKATITANGQTKNIRYGRCRIVQDGADGTLTIEGPLPPEQNLIVNGTFDALLGGGWQEPVLLRQDNADPLGEVKIVAADGKRVLAFQRSGARTHGELSVMQRIDKDVRDFSSLKLSCEVLVRFQSLPGGGFKSTEFPIMVELTYKDAKGDSRVRHWGFYYLNPDTGPEWEPMINGIKVVQREWYLFETDNLMHSMTEFRPVYIENIRIYSSGWDVDSAITNISLQVQE